MSIRKFTEMQEHIKDIWRRLKYLESNFVENYFYDCPCCDGNRLIIKDIAVSFRRRDHSGILYTTKESYEVHKVKIEEWEKGFKK